MNDTIHLTNTNFCFLFHYVFTCLLKINISLDIMFLLNKSIIKQMWEKHQWLQSFITTLAKNVVLMVMEVLKKRKHIDLNKYAGDEC